MTKKIAVIDKNNNSQIEALNDFCLHNDLVNVAYDLVNEKEDKKPFINFYLGAFQDDKIVDYCYFHGESDLKHAVLSFPTLIKKPKERIIVKEAINMAFSLGMEDISVLSKDASLDKTLLTEGFMSLGQEDGVSIYLLPRSEVKEGSKYL